MMVSMSGALTMIVDGNDEPIRLWDERLLKFGATVLVFMFHKIQGCSYVTIPFGFNKGNPIPDFFFDHEV